MGSPSIQSRDTLQTGDRGKERKTVTICAHTSHDLPLFLSIDLHSSSRPASFHRATAKAASQTATVIRRNIAADYFIAGLDAVKISFILATAANTKEY